MLPPPWAVGLIGPGRERLNAPGACPDVHQAPPRPVLTAPLPSRVFSISVQTRFSAAHAILIRGVRESLHGHDWRVVAVISGPALDPDGLLADFHAVEGELGAIVEPFRNTNMNECPPFDRVNPTAEEVARHIGDRLSSRLETRLPRDPKTDLSAQWFVDSVSVTEAPNCVATYRPSRTPGDPRA